MRYFKKGLACFFLKSKGVCASCFLLCLYQVKSKQNSNSTKRKPKPASPATEEDYAKVELPFEEGCPFCLMMKASPCNQAFINFHQCAGTHAPVAKTLIP